MKNKGFICTIPYNKIDGIGIKENRGDNMKIVDYLKEDMLVLELKAEKKEDAIRELGTVICKSKSVIDSEKFISDVFEREEMCTTGIGNEVAIPHARTDNVKKFVVSFGRSLKGVEFESLDHKPVKLIFLMGTPKSSGMKQYLHILAHLNRMLQKEDFRKQLLKANSPAGIIEIFKNEEE